jgi:manganese transport protein
VAMARRDGAVLHLLHVEEGVTSQLFGEISSTAEIQSGAQYFRGITEALTKDGIPSELTVVHGRNPKDVIVRVAREMRPDLIVMGAHGHRGVKDVILGNTINGVRHEVSAPVLVVGEPEDKEGGL